MLLTQQKIENKVSQLENDVYLYMHKIAHFQNQLSFSQALLIRAWARERFLQVWQDV